MAVVIIEYVMAISLFVLVVVQQLVIVIVHVMLTSDRKVNSVCWNTWSLQHIISGIVGCSCFLQCSNLFNSQ